MTSWWNKNAQNRMEDFKIWVGDFNQPSKTYCRNYIKSQGYLKILDCGCGLASDFYGFIYENYPIDYTGVDSCKLFIDLNREQNITMIEAELEGDLPIVDSSYDCVYSREVLEHLSYYDKALSEMIRIAAKEVIIVFFIKPENEENINYWETEDLYHNTYDINKLQDFILSFPKVESITWSEINDQTDRKDVIDEINKLIENPEEQVPEKQTVKLPKHILHIKMK